MSRRDIAKSGEPTATTCSSTRTPESFDEVFWRIFSGDEYLGDDRLVAYRPDDEVVNKYVRYVNAILAASDTPHERYLSKNNNNILRLGALHQAFPNALILIPFERLCSMLTPFCASTSVFKMQSEQKFVLRYMTWLGHHEFGLDHRPFQFDGSARPPYAPDTLNYWLTLWCDTYSWLERSKPEAARFVCYEDLCTRPEVLEAARGASRRPPSKSRATRSSSATSRRPATSTAVWRTALARSTPVSWRVRALGSVDRTVNRRCHVLRASCFRGRTGAVRSRVRFGSPCHSSSHRSAPDRTP
jgi:hypothetical protein